MSRLKALMPLLYLPFAAGCGGEATVVSDDRRGGRDVAPYADSRPAVLARPQRERPSTRVSEAVALRQPATAHAAAANEAAEGDESNPEATAQAPPADPQPVIIDGRVSNSRVHLHPDEYSVAAAIPWVQDGLLRRLSGKPPDECGPLIRQGQSRVRHHLAKLAGLRRQPPAARRPPSLSRAVRTEADVLSIDRQTVQSSRVMLDGLTDAAGLLAADDADSRQLGLRIAWTAATKAMQLFRDAELAAAIADAYLVPNLDAANPDHVRHLSAEGTLRTVMACYVAAEQNEKVLAVAYALLNLAQTPSTADFALLRAAQALELLGRPVEATDALDRLSDGGVLGGEPVRKRLRAASAR